MQTDSRISGSTCSLKTTLRGATSLNQVGPPLLLLVLGLGVTFFLASLMKKQDEKSAQLAFESRVSQASSSIFHAFSVPVELALNIPAFLDASDQVDPDEFERFVTPALQRHHALTALEWAPYIAGSGREEFEKLAGRPILEASEEGLTEARQRRDYFPIYYMVPDNQNVRGLDVGFEPSRRLLVDRAVRSGQPVCSSRFQLVEDAAGVYSIAIYAPVYWGESPTTESQRLERIRGLAIALFRLKPVIEQALAGQNLQGLGFSFLDDSAESENTLLYDQKLELPAGLKPLRWEGEVKFLRNRWRIAWQGDPREFAVGSMAPTVLIVGILLTLLVSGVLFSVLLVTRMRKQMREVLQLGNYTLRRKLGEGGMGSVYLADHALLRRQTAIKLIRPEAVGPEAQERFEREVRYTSQLTHPNTIQVYDYGHTPEGVFYYAMEYLEGITLEDLVKQTGPLEPSRALRIFEQICGSLAEAHARGMIHRDLKPENIMVCYRGGIGDFVKVLDFGLVKHFEGSLDVSLSHASALVGTPTYMAPEAMAGSQNLSAAADVYSLGSVLYYLLTGQPVFEASSLMALMTQVLTVPPEHPALRLGRPLPEELSQLVLACLAKSPAERPPHAMDLLERLLTIQLEQRWDQDRARSWWKGEGLALRQEIHEKHTSQIETDQTLLVDVLKRGSSVRKTA